MARKVAVVGAGMWGTTMAGLLASKGPTALWARRPELADDVNRRRANRAYVPGLALPEALRATAALDDALDGAEVVVMAVPSHGFRAVLGAARPYLPPGVPVVSLTKGVEQGTLKRMTEIIEEVAPGHPRAVLTGPNLGQEVAAGQPTASVVAAHTGGDHDESLACDLQRLFSTDAFRVYTNADLVGCELGGALKNVIAIASGITDGMGLGDNTRAALITRGLAELTRIGVALGGRPLTFAGLAGMGDLVATCMSRTSRNRSVGEQLGRGRTIADVTAETRMVAEGVRTSSAVVELARRVGVDTPIADQVVAVLYGGRRAADALAALMQRVMKPELHGLATYPSGGP